MKEHASAGFHRVSVSDDLTKRLKECDVQLIQACDAANQDLDAAQIEERV